MFKRFRILLGLLSVFYCGTVSIWGLGTFNSLITIRESYLRALLLPDTDAGNEDSFVTYMIDAYLDREASPIRVNQNDGYNLLSGYTYADQLMQETMGDLKDGFMLGYVPTEYPTGQYFSYELTRALLLGGQGLLAAEDTDFSYLPGGVGLDDMPMRFRASSTQESIDALMDASLDNTVMRDSQSSISQYGLQDQISGSKYAYFGDVLSQIDYALYGMVSCTSSYLPNQCLSCKTQYSQDFYPTYNYLDESNSSCSMRSAYINKPWNGARAMIASLRVVQETLHSDTLDSTLPSVVANSGYYKAYRNGSSCLISDLIKLYELRGNWKHFYHWSRFSENGACQELLDSAGRSVDTTSASSLGSLYDYFFGGSSSTSSTSTAESPMLSAEAINVVNLIDGYVKNASAGTALQNDPTKALQQALTMVLFQVRTIMNNQMTLASVDLVKEKTAEDASVMSDDMFRGGIIWIMLVVIGWTQGTPAAIVVWRAL